MNILTKYWLNENYSKFIEIFRKTKKNDKINKISMFKLFSKYN